MDSFVWMGCLMFTLVTIHKKLYFLLQGNKSCYWYRGDTSWKKTTIPGSTEEDGLAVCFWLMPAKLMWSEIFSNNFQWINTQEMCEVEHATFLNDQAQSTVICATLKMKSCTSNMAIHTFWICQNHSLY